MNSVSLIENIKEVKKLVVVKDVRERKGGKNKEEYVGF